MIDPFLIDLIGLSRRMWSEYTYVDIFKDQRNKNIELVLGSPFSIKQMAEMLDAVLARKLIQMNVNISELHRPLQTAVIREQQREKSRQEGL